MHNDSNPIRLQLRAAGLRATPARQALLQLLQSAERPLDVHAIIRAFPHAVDQATVYRMLNVFVAAGLVREVGLRAGVAHFEIASGPHHHHVVCERCGLVEDVGECRVPHHPDTASFAQVLDHRLEFSGICKSCITV